ncbi:fructose-bisphosphate aldolase class I [Stigmatella aurantiaca DW4/3-1]|uniref:fructose-bisphosphate aldolase n=2 Tax=Stigmatella aurantiaca TaxID=41 RepID=Q08T15_STIAD|nr:fructose-bisphosphate aldolase class I [Stigmatella aurantiaca DW4/3-1]
MCFTGWPRSRPLLLPRIAAAQHLPSQGRRHRFFHRPPAFVQRTSAPAPRPPAWGPGDTFSRDLLGAVGYGEAQSAPFSTGLGLAGPGPRPRSHMAYTDRVKQILSWYPSDNPGTLTNLARLLNTGALAGTGKLVILPVDQGFEHGPARSFGPNVAGYDPDYHAQLAIETGCSAYAAPLGFLEAIAGKLAGEIPLILKVNNSDTLAKVPNPISAVTSSVKDAVRLGCAAVGYTIYPGSGARNEQYQDLRDIIAEAKSYGLPTVLWAYARGAISKEGETGIDVIAYAAHISAQLGAHIIKVKPPTDFIEQPEAKKAFEKAGIATKTLADRVREVVRSSFNGKRIVIFSGGESKSTPELLEDIKQIHQGGGFGSIMGRNAFQRPHDESVKLLKDVMGIFAGK